MITEDYVSFETAKLLKEKGFDGNGVCRESYDVYTMEILPHGSKHGGQINAPTLQLAMKWIRKVYNIHVTAIVAYHHIPRRYEAHIMKLENIDDFILHQQVDFASYEEACEAAIKYCLENLI